MKRKLLHAAVALSLGVSATAYAGLSFNPDGVAGGAATIDVGSFDWGPTSFVAKDGRTALANWVGSGGACPDGACSFDAYMHATMIGSLDSNNKVNTMTGLNSKYEITMIMRLPEVVTNFIGGSVATFAVDTSRAAMMEIYYDSTPDSNSLEGQGFDDGKLILRSDLAAAAVGLYAITGQNPVALDQSANGNQYDGQQTLTGTGSSGNLAFGNLTYDSAFFKSVLEEFGIEFANISIGLPFISVDPSDCFTLTSSGVAVGANNATSSCTGANTAHVDGLYSAQLAAGLRGYTPMVGAVNSGLAFGPDSPDFLGQTDFNSPVHAVPVPEPATLSLLGLGLLGLGASLRRNRKAV